MIKIAVGDIAEQNKGNKFLILVNLWSLAHLYIVPKEDVVHPEFINQIDEFIAWTAPRYANGIPVQNVNIERIEELLAEFEMWAKANGMLFEHRTIAELERLN